MDEILCDLAVFFGITDADRQLSSAEFFRIIPQLPAYKGAVRLRLEVYAQEHKEEIEEMRKVKNAPIPVPANSAMPNPAAGPRPELGQAAPLFDVRSA